MTTLRTVCSSSTDALIDTTVISSANSGAKQQLYYNTCICTVLKHMTVYVYTATLAFSSAPVQLFTVYIKNWQM
jgi:hypothetical protein